MGCWKRDFPVVSIYMQEFRTVGSSLVTVFNWLMGGVDLKIFNGTHNPEIGLVLLLLYWFAMSMVLLNCLIAIMADACSRVRATSDADASHLICQTAECFSLPSLRSSEMPAPGLVSTHLFLLTQRFALSAFFCSIISNLEPGRCKGFGQQGNQVYCIKFLIEPVTNYLQTRRTPDAWIL